MQNWFALKIALIELFLGIQKWMVLIFFLDEHCQDQTPFFIDYDTNNTHCLCKRCGLMKRQCWWNKPTKPSIKHYFGFNLSTLTGAIHWNDSRFLQIRRNKENNKINWFGFYLTHSGLQCALNSNLAIVCCYWLIKKV